MLKKYTLCFVFFLFSASYSLSAQEKNTCTPPYKPNNIFTVIFNYKEAMTYISEAKETCSQVFSQELAETFRESFWVSKGCLKITLQDIKKAQNTRKKLLPLKKVKVSN